MFRCIQCITERLNVL